MKRNIATITLLILCTTWLCTCCNGKNDTKQNTIDTLWLNNGDRKIFGELYKPAKSSGIVIFSHGFNGTHRDGQKYYKLFGELGYQCFSFDFPCGSIHSKSDNNAYNMSVVDETSDLRAIISYFKANGGDAADNIILIGESQGGLVSSLTAAEQPADISKLILIFPAFCIPDNWNERYPNASDIPDSTEIWGLKLGKRYFEQVRTIKPFEKMAQFKKPVLIIQGDKDPIVSMDDSRRACRTYPHSQLHVILGAGHGFKSHEHKLSSNYIKEFLK